MDERLHNAPCGFFVLNSQGNIIEVNRTFLNYLSHDQDEVIGKHIDVMLSAASRMMYHTMFYMQIQSRGQVDEVQLAFKRKDGSSIPLLVYGNHGDQGEMDCVAVNISRHYNYEQEIQNIRKKMEAAYQSENRLHELFERTLYSIGDGIIATDLEGKVTLMNPAAEEHTGWKKDEAFGHDVHQVFNCIDQVSGRTCTDPIQEVIDTGQRVELNNGISLRSKDGNEIYITGSASRISWNGEVNGMLIAFKDITKEYTQEKEIEGFLNLNLDMLCVADLDAKFHKVNKKFEEVLGYATEELVGKNFLSFIHADDMQNTLEAIQDLAQNKFILGFTNRYRCKDGTYKYLEWQAQPGVAKYTYASARDVTEKKLKEEQLQKIATRDQLTGLHNRHYLESILDSETQKSDLYDQPITLAIMDLDHFKQVNDTWGHPVGDDLLRLTAKVAEKNIRNTDILVRFGGEEFVLLMPQTKLDGAVIGLEKIRKSIEEQVHPVAGKRSVSIGAAERHKFESFHDWYKRADEALYRAKKAGRNCIKI